MAKEITVSSYKPSTTGVSHEIIVPTRIGGIFCSVYYSGQLLAYILDLVDCHREKFVTLAQQEPWTYSGIVSKVKEMVHEFEELGSKDEELKCKLPEDADDFSNTRIKEAKC